MIKSLYYFAAHPCSFWIGLRRIQNNQSYFVWDDGTPLGIYENWNQGDGKNENETCVIMGFSCDLPVFSNNWFDISCDGVTYINEDYLCQKLSNPNTGTLLKNEHI